MRRIMLHLLGYLFYAVIVFGVCLYFMFPYKALGQRLTEQLSGGGVRVTTGEVGRHFPFGIQAHDVRVVSEVLADQGALMQFGKVQMSPELLPLLAGKLRGRFVGTLYNGHVEGVVRRTKTEGVPWDVQASFVDLDVAQHPLLRQKDKAFMSGRLSGDSTMTFARDGQMQEGVFTLRGQPFVFMLGPMLSLQQLQRDVTCDSLQGEVKVSTKQAGNVFLTCKGNDLIVEANGTVVWRSPVAESQLNLRWRAQSEASYKQELDLLGALVRRRPDRRGELSFRMQGALRQPRFGA